MSSNSEFRLILHFNLLDKFIIIYQQRGLLDGDFLIETVNVLAVNKVLATTLNK